MIVEKIIPEIIQAGIVITSGMAQGIDSLAHNATVYLKKPTIAVLGAGILEAKKNRYAQQTMNNIISNNGLIVSEYPPFYPASRYTFPARNRIVSGLSLGTLVIEAGIKSGTLITTSYALEQNREIFAIPGSIHNPLSRGCHSLIRQGAKLVETAEDIIEELLPLEKLVSTSHTSGQYEETQAKNSLDPAYQALLNSMEYEPANIDELVERNQMDAADIASMLLILELQGHVVSENGNYSRIHSELNH